MTTFILLTLAAALMYGSTRLVDWTIDLPRPWRRDKRPIRLGFSHDAVTGNDTGRYIHLPREERYLERWLLWHPWGTLRVHRFWAGDDTTAPHDHPWWFITFPFSSYEEHYWDFQEKRLRYRFVQRWRFHHRASTYRHIVQEPSTGRRIFTFVIAGPWERKWGFWPKPDQFVPWRVWLSRPRVSGDES